MWRFCLWPDWNLSPCPPHSAKALILKKHFRIPNSNPQQQTLWQMYFTFMIFLIHTNSLKPHAGRCTYHMSIRIFPLTSPSPHHALHKLFCFVLFFLNQTCSTFTRPQELLRFQISSKLFPTQTGSEMEFSTASEFQDETHTFNHAAHDNDNNAWSLSVTFPKAQSIFKNHVLCFHSIVLGKEREKLFSCLANNKTRVVIKRYTQDPSIWSGRRQDRDRTCRFSKMMVCVFQAHSSSDSTASQLSPLFTTTHLLLLLLLLF